VKADGHVVWKGAIDGTLLDDIDGPAGFRSDKRRLHVQVLLARPVTKTTTAEEEPPLITKITGKLLQVGDDTVTLGIEAFEYEGTDSRIHAQAVATAKWGNR